MASHRKKERATKMAKPDHEAPQGRNSVGERGTQLVADRSSECHCTSSERSQDMADEATQRWTVKVNQCTSGLDQSRMLMYCSYQEGVVVEKGSHDELMQTDGVYHQLVTYRSNQPKVEKSVSTS
ncbi:hypothetical protein ACROYT_G018924 [Oculina patagonica]